MRLKDRNPLSAIQKTNNKTLLHYGGQWLDDIISVH